MPPPIILCSLLQPEGCRSITEETRSLCKTQRVRSFSKSSSALQKAAPVNPSIAIRTATAPLSLFTARLPEIDINFFRLAQRPLVRLSPRGPPFIQSHLDRFVWARRHLRSPFRAP